MGFETRYKYDALGQLVAVIDANQGESKAEYDADGRLTSATTPLGLVTSYQYDEMGRVVKKTNPDATSVKYTYDANGNRTSMTDARGNSSAYEYDKLNRRHHRPPCGYRQLAASYLPL